MSLETNEMMHKWSQKGGGHTVRRRSTPRRGDPMSSRTLGLGMSQPHSVNSMLCVICAVRWYSAFDPPLSLLGYGVIMAAKWTSVWACHVGCATSNAHPRGSSCVHEPPCLSELHVWRLRCHTVGIMLSFGLNTTGGSPCFKHVHGGGPTCNLSEYVRHH